MTSIEEIKEELHSQSIAVGCDMVSEVPYNGDVKL